MLLKSHSKLVMIGDSVTDCGRTQPVGEGLFEAHGRGYVAMVAAMLNVTYPDSHIRIVNMGTSGNTVRDLKARWQHDVIAMQPDWLSIMIGINDVWRQFDSPTQAEIHVGLVEYTSTLEELIRDTLPLLQGMVLLTPYYIETNRADQMRATMDRYGTAVRMLGLKYGTYFVDTQAAFDRLLLHSHSAAIAWDRVHPNQTGHMVIAQAFLNAIGFQYA